MLGRSEIRALTGLRGTAACFVMLYHYSAGRILYGPARPILLHGYLAVDLFFVLSGFVMALNYGSAFARGFSSRAFLVFLHKRFGRVYPLYIVVTLAMAALAYTGSIGHGPPSTGTLLSNVLLIQAWGFADSIGGPSWSISTEFAAYLLFPVLLAAVQGRRWAPSCIAAIACVAVLAFVASRTSTELNQISDGVAQRNGPLDAVGTGTLYPLLRCLAGFMLGLLAFRIAQTEAAWRLLGRRYAGDVVMAAVVVLMAVPGSDVALVVLFVPLIAALAAENSLTARLLRGPVVHWLGAISYSIYLMHLLVSDLLEKSVLAKLNALHVPHAFSIAPVLVVVPTIVFSAASYYFIEEPARDLTRKLIPALQTVPRMYPPS
jgi:peptidoglycan/LPS O-acetylase OafA/YrhL